MMTIEIIESPNQSLESLVLQSVNKYLEIAFENIAEQLPKDVARVFDGQGVRDGEGENWIPTSTIARLMRVNPAARAPGSPTLIDTGSYMKSFQVIQFAKDQNQYLLEVGSNQDEKAETLEYGAFVEFESEIFYVPARPAHFITDADRDMINRAVEISFQNE